MSGRSRAQEAVGPLLPLHQLLTTPVSSPKMLPAVLVTAGSQIAAVCGRDGFILQGEWHIYNKPGLQDNTRAAFWLDQARVARDLPPLPLPHTAVVVQPCSIFPFSELQTWCSGSFGTETDN